MNIYDNEKTSTRVWHGFKHLTVTHITPLCYNNISLVSLWTKSQTRNESMEQWYWSFWI